MTSSADGREAIPEGFANRWTDVFRSDSLIHLLLLTSIVAGAFQGWLKDRIPGVLPYALSDGAFILAAVLWFATAAVYRRPLLRAPAGTNVDLVLLAIVLTPFLYVIVAGTPFLVKMAGLRAWSAFPVACLIGMSVVRTAGQVRAYVGVIVATCLVTGLYGIAQYMRGPEAALDTTLGELRHGQTVFYHLEAALGSSEFRAFSTFTFPAPFAAMMVFGILLCAGIVFCTSRPLGQRVLAALIVPVLFVAMTVSGTRAALVTLVAGMLVLGWLRRFTLAQLLLLPALLLGLHFATILTSGRIVTRYSSLLREGAAWGYVVTPILTAGEGLAEHPFGLGLGRSGVGVPFAIANSMGRGYFVFSDGDIGRAVIELGIIGLVLLVFIVVGLLPVLLRIAPRLRGGPEGDLALGIGALVISGGIVILIGSPLSTTPHAIIWWFLFGALVRLWMLREPDAGETPNHYGARPTAQVL